MHPDGYFALVLTPASAALVAASFATLPRHICHHCTVRHGTRDPADLPPAFTESDLGKTFGLRVRGFQTRSDGGIQAVVVSLLLPSGELLEGGFSANPIPHVTIATDGVADPVEANALLEGGFEPIEGPVLQALLVHTKASSSG